MDDDRRLDQREQREHGHDHVADRRQCPRPSIRSCRDRPALRAHPAPGLPTTRSSHARPGGRAPPNRRSRTPGPRRSAACARRPRGAGRRSRGRSARRRPRRPGPGSRRAPASPTSRRGPASSARRGPARAGRPRRRGRSRTGAAYWRRPGRSRARSGPDDRHVTITIARPPRSRSRSSGAPRPGVSSPRARTGGA